MKSLKRKSRTPAAKPKSQALAKRTETAGADAAYRTIAEILQTARATAYRAVNEVMVQAYWQIGRVIVEEEQKGRKRAGYGEALLAELARRLTNDFGRGFDERNLRHIRQFYLTFPIRNALRSELSWTHYRLLLRVDREDARSFYEIEAANNRWSTRELDRQIGSLLYERLALSRDKKKVLELAAEGQIVREAEDLIKDPYVLEFLNVKENQSLLEKDLEQGLIDRLQAFLLELGKGFALVARQRRISVGGDHYYVDLVFYNYLLRSFLLIVLKTGKLAHQDIGQMDFYVRYFEQEEKSPGDGPVIGLILCSDKNEAMVRYTLLEDRNKIFASKYKLYLP
ncbi:MAG: PDDEXK nuclease domain-containing protein, partial [Blastocatellia bacterium]